MLIFVDLFMNENISSVIMFICLPLNRIGFLFKSNLYALISLKYKTDFHVRYLLFLQIISSCQEGSLNILLFFYVLFFVYVFSCMTI